MRIQIAALMLLLVFLCCLGLLDLWHQSRDTAGRSGNPRRELRMTTLLNTVPPPARSFATLRNANTIEQIMEALKLWEGFNVSARDTPPNQVSAVTFSTPSNNRPPRRCFVCQSTQHLASYHSTNSSSSSSS